MEILLYVLRTNNSVPISLELFDTFSNFFVCVLRTNNGVPISLELF